MDKESSSEESKDEGSCRNVTAMLYQYVFDCECPMKGVRASD